MTARPGVKIVTEFATNRAQVSQNSFDGVANFRKKNSWLSKNLGKKSFKFVFSKKKIKVVKLDHDCYK